MTEVEVLDIARDAMATMLIVSMPILLVGLAVGLLVSIFQTLTHIQEMTLTFIPKIVAVFGTALLLLPWMLRHLTEFTERMMDKIVGLG
jgi:flagellar biosynthetic protein FliQ